MFSVTQRIRTVSQPWGGFVPRALFSETAFLDNFEVKEILPAFSSIQGLAVDYLSRFFISRNKKAAFHISILGAERVDAVYGNNNERNRIFELLDKVNGLDDNSIISACKIVGYDVAYRYGVNAFQDVARINPPLEVVQNIQIMVKRSLDFFKLIGPIIKDEITFEGGYTRLVESGDGDFLTKDSIIDLKVSKHSFSNTWSLQLLMYYLLGIHSNHDDLKNVLFLCVFNPYENKSYSCDVRKISDESKYRVSHEVLGYKMLSSDLSEWDKVTGTDSEIYDKFVSEHTKKEFYLDKYEDGIHKLTIDDYWSFLQSNDAQYWGQFRPKFTHADYILMIKREGYLMFLSQSKNGMLNVLNGASPRHADYSPQYYYANILLYANAVTRFLQKYWQALFSISEQIQKLAPSKETLQKTYYSSYIRRCTQAGKRFLPFDAWYLIYKNRFSLSGRVHGCIVDLDFNNHIYLNPYDGTLTSYYAVSKYDKDVYKNVISLLSAKRPEILKLLNRPSLKEDNGTASLALLSSNDKYSLFCRTDIIETETEKVYSTEMYDLSDKLNPLQSIYDKQLIKVWYDEFLNGAYESLP